MLASSRALQRFSSRPVRKTSVNRKSPLLKAPARICGHHKGGAGLYTYGGGTSAWVFQLGPTGDSITGGKEIEQGFSLMGS
jgi:hypothetical protein